MNACAHPRRPWSRAGFPLCFECHSGLTAEESHYLSVCFEATQRGFPIVTEPHKSISRERAEAIVKLVQGKAKPPAGKQDSLF